LSLALHHVNGNKHDNRLENLALLCPNCHSQTPNFGVKNRARRAA
jgi:5-methylcytosine-specific restriction endonuclease McrA